MRTISIRFKITAITVAAVLVAIVCIFGASYPTIRDETNERSVEMMRLIGEDTKNILDEYFVGIEQSVGMAANMAIDSLDRVVLVECGAAGSYAGKSERTPEQIARLDAYLADHCEQIRRTFESVASHTQSVITYYYCINPEVSENEHGFFYSRVGKAGFVEQEPLDARTLDPEDIEHTTWYYTPIQRGIPLWVGPYTAHFLGEMWTCSYLVPIYSTGTLIGVLGMDIALDTLVAQVSPIRVYKTGFACLCDADGRILYHPTLEPWTMPQLSDVSDWGELIREENSGDRAIRYTVDGEQRQMSFSTLRNGMKLVVTAPVREINSSWNNLLRVILIIAAAVIVVFAVIVMLAMRIITFPLLRLTAAAQRLADADYNVALSYKRNDEIGVLTRAFIRMRDQIKKYIEDLNHRVNTDSLTDLPNMRCFFKLASAERQRFQAEGKSSAVLYFDLIGMKHYNRQYGFEEGDKLLREFGRILADQYGENCMCRYSDDHFAALCDERRLDKTLRSVFQKCESANGGNSLPVRVGVYRNSLEDVDVGVACDRAKYACDKHRGSYVSGYYFFDEQMLTQLDDVRYIINHLDQALSEGWIKVFYQPIIRAVNGHVCDEEALSRWIDPDRGLISPVVFIPILEKARLIYKLDLYVLDQILDKMRKQTREGLRLVPHSVNLSRADFDACDIVEEIRRRVDAAGIARDKLTIEVTESIIGSDFDFMREQVRRFHELGFQVWMDDFGSGYSSLDVLQDIHFDLLKFDMRFMKRFYEGEKSKVILTDLVRMAIDLGIDTVCEGVETEEEAEFLQEIGCSKLQGFHYCKPIPFEEILERYREGKQIGFENPEETEYYNAIGRVNLYDLTVIADKEGMRQNYFDTLPVGIMEVKGDHAHYIRTNPAFREYLKRYFDVDLSARKGDPAARESDEGVNFIRQVQQCCEIGERTFYDGKLPDGSFVHGVLNPIGKNPVSGTSAVAVAVLSIKEPDLSTTYADIARALAADYYNIYVVDLDTDRFIEYSSQVGEEELAMERHGADFFESARRDTMTRIYEEDREAFLTWFSKENIVRELDNQGAFNTTYRLIDTGAPMYVNMKITRMQGGNRIIIGISIVDSQMKQKEHLEELQKERDTMARVMALSDGYLTLYTVDLGTGNYIEFSSTEDYDSLGTAKEGKDFFGQTRVDVRKHLYTDDQEAFLEQFTKENILRGVREGDGFRIAYRLMINGEPRQVILKAALFKEGGEEKLLVGVRPWKQRQ